MAVAERDGELVGIAMSGLPLDAERRGRGSCMCSMCMPPTTAQVPWLALLEAVVDPEESVALWVADPNPRAQAFYRKHGFVADGTAQVEAREIRMVRGMQRRR